MAPSSKQKNVMSSQAISPLQDGDAFAPRHIGPNTASIAGMLETLGCESMRTLIDQTIPSGIRMDGPLELNDEIIFKNSSVSPMGELRTLEAIRELSEENQTYRSYIGMGYNGTITPSVILRAVLENPCWYTQYTPYQAEISQGRLEALLNFQTMICDLTGLPIANASLLDDATAAAEAMSMCVAATRRRTFFVSGDCHPQTIGVLETRAKGLGIDLLVGNINDADFASRDFAGVIVQYPATDGRISDFTSLSERIHGAGR